MMISRRPQAAVEMSATLKSVKPAGVMTALIEEFSIRMVANGRR